MSSANIPNSPTSALAPSKRKRHIILWTILVLFVLLLLWSVFSSNPFAQGLRQLGGVKPDQIVLQKSFTVSPRSFRYYKFALSEGSAKVSLVGQFTSVAVPGHDRTGTDPSDSGIELLILTETGFQQWQRKQGTGFVYDSGVASQAKVQAQIPQGAGVYYLVFNNRSSITNAKNLTATLRLHYGSWVPEWLRRLNALFFPRWEPHIATVF